MTTVVADTKRTTQEIFSRTEMDGSRFVYKIDSENVPILETKLIEYPDLKTTVAVVAGDTYDEALNMYKLKTDTDLMPVCVLNFANAYKPGGGWLSGAQAQEEQLCYRSTLAGTLDERLYPLKHEEVFYSPQVIVYRGNNAKGYRFMDKHFVVSVVSMAAINGPILTPDNSTYLNKSDREIMISRMRTVLRTAGQNNHRRLALGPVGCGVFGNPPQAVADCWKSVLLEKEFHGWFERIHFIIKDRHGSNNFEPFKKTLDGLSM
ncbi:hypothetical protein N7475_002190 [Penicillium sp. IBT 31633x]|nr:hypothetical protein N7475_002190 [Penicillium sp. IBT 31633x]